MKSLLVLLVVTSLAGCSGPSQEDIKVASDACQEFIAKKMRVSLDDTKVFDAWSKNGAVVLDVGYKKKYWEDSYSVRRCVYDEKKGTISSPSPLNDSEWAK
jgi:hypothetical protein